MSYIIIRASIDKLKTLARTFLSSGYTFEEIKSKTVRLPIGNICWREGQITKMTKQEIRQAKDNLDDNWLEAIAEFSGIVIAEHKPLENPTYKPIPKKIEKIPEIEPTDRIILSSAGEEVPFDEGILAELAALGTVLKDIK